MKVYVVLEGRRPGWRPLDWMPRRGRVLAVLADEVGARTYLCGLQKEIGRVLWFEEWEVETFAPGPPPRREDQPRGFLIGRGG